MRVADDEHRIGAGVHADGHPQHDVALSRVDLAHVTQRAPHRRGRAARPDGMLLPLLLVVEQEQHRVAAELQQRAAPAIGLGQQRREAGVDRVDQLLGAFLPAPGQPLGQAGEARHVREDHRALNGLGQYVDRARQAGEHRPGHVRSERPIFRLHLRSEPQPIAPRRRLDAV